MLAGTLKIAKKTTQGKLVGQKIVITGFRDKTVEKYIVDNGGTLNDSVSKNTTLVIYADNMDENTMAQKYDEIIKSTNEANEQKRGQLLEQLNYLDDFNFPLENSDHDLFARAWHFHKWICGYVPIEFDSPLEHGSTRKPRDKLNTEVLKNKLNQSNGGFLKQYLEILTNLFNLFDFYLIV